MITIYKRKTRYANDYYEFVADTEADIASAEQTIKELLGRPAGIHSNIFVIKTGEKYFRDKEGNWNKAGEPIAESTFAEATPLQLKKNVLSGKAVDLYSVGDTRQITLKNGETMTLRLANNTTDLYERSDGSGTTGFVLEFVECFGTKYYMNSTRTNDGGWNASYMHTTVMSLILARLPDEWQEVVATVKIKSGNGYSTGNAVIESDDKLFLPAEREIFASRVYSAQTEWDTLTRWQWYAQHDTDADRVKTLNGSAAGWWERSSSGSNIYNFCNVNGVGNSSSSTASLSYSIAPAFCL